MTPNDIISPSQNISFKLETFVTLYIPTQSIVP